MSEDLDFPGDDPGIVWHYTDGAGLLSILRNHVLWATAAPFLNDREEVELGIGLLRGRLRQRLDAGKADHVIAKIEDTRQELGSTAAGAFFILSASQDWDSLAMWRCYGGSGESYAIGLDAEQQLPVLGDGDPPKTPDVREDRYLVRQRNWAPVVYDEAEQCALVDAVLDDLPGTVSLLKSAQGRKEDFDVDAVAGLFDRLELALLLAKHPGFRDERETRLATALYADPDDLNVTEATRNFVRYRATAYGLAPYLWLTGADPDRPAGGARTGAPYRLPIRGVAISPSPNGRAAENSLRTLMLRAGYGRVPVRRSGIPFRQ